MGEPQDGSPGRVRYRVVVSGRVQGVWYRDACREVATEVGVAGWIRNKPDGTVEAAVEGPPDAVRDVVEWMRSGPRRAAVTGVDTVEEEPRGDGTFVVS